MAYQSLYRRYRPRRFAEVLGQEQVVGALRNAVRDDRVGHLYLFSGPRGTGKTSTARILAKALNCTNLQDGEPCCECEACLSIEAGTSYDVQELDAASNNKVENVRDLIERVALGSPGRTKVYILDEVHMLSPGASNALLKTLEEPPPHVVFVLATTDPHKVLATMVSRSQHFEFHLLPADVLAEHVRWVVADAGLAVADDAIEQVVRQGGGSARDTLSALDQVAAAGGVTDNIEHAIVVVDAVCARDTGLALRTVADAVGAGREPRILGESVLACLRDAFLVRMGAALPQATDNQRERAAAWAAQLTDRAATLALEEVGAALLEMRQAPDPRIPLEVALVKLTRAPEGDVAALIDRVDRLERALESGGSIAPAAQVAASRPAPAAAAATEAPASSTPAPAAGQPPAERPAAPPAPLVPADDSRRRPADAARAMLARSGTAPASPRSAKPEAEVSPPPAPRPTGPAPEATAEPTPEQAPAAPAAAELTAAEFVEGWSTAVVPKLAGMTGAMYRPAAFVGIDGNRATFAVNNDVSRLRCEQKQGEVEGVLSAHFGRPIKLVLVVDADARPDTPSNSPAPTPAPVDDVPDEIDLIDVRQLEDAPPDNRTGVDRLAEAFPGAVLEEEPG